MFATALCPHGNRSQSTSRFFDDVVIVVATGRLDIHGSPGSIAPASTEEIQEKAVWEVASVQLQVQDGGDVDAQTSSASSGK